MPLGANKAAIMGVAGVSTATVVLLNTITATSDTTITFNSGITSTYGEYIFKFYNINPETDNTVFHFQVNATDDPGGGYDTSEITSTYFHAEHPEDDSSTSLQYVPAQDQAQGTAYSQINYFVGSGADESCAGELHIFNPSSTTYVKHFIGKSNVNGGNDYLYSAFFAGYINDTTAIDDIQFKMAAGDFDGTIKMWGVK